jgi:aspartokinase/homoserine dehydrogenase 1
MKAGIPIVICNTFEPNFPGTRIEQQPKGKNGIIKGLSSIENIALVTVRGSGMIGVSGIAARIFKALAEAGINIIMITQASSEHTICLAILSKFAKDAQREIEDEFRIEIMEESIDRVLIEDDMCIIAVVGDHMQRTPGIAGLVFQAMGKNEINIVAIAQGSSERNISFIVKANDEAGAMTALHDAFFSKTAASGRTSH